MSSEPGEMSSNEGRNGLYRQRSDFWSDTRDEEFQEDDVWSVFREPKSSNSKIGKFKNSSSFTIRRMPTAARMIPRSNSTVIHEPKAAQQQHSAPVSIPDWSKIYGSPRAASSRWANGDDDGGAAAAGGGSSSDTRDSWDSDIEEDDDGTMLPPHEWVTRRLARTQGPCFSMCEGVGRTLKGRDLSKVRNAVLTKTGFLE